MTIDEALENLRANPRDVAAWEVIALDVYQPLLVYVASLLLTFRVSAGETAHDIVHDVLLTFYERWPQSKATITSVSALRAYLRASCRNLLIDRYRRQHHAQQLIDFLDLKFSNAFQDESGLYSSILLNEIFEMLHPNCASLLRQYVKEDLSPAEIADKEGKSPATFYSRWYRCIQQVKKIIMQKKEALKRF
jgi:RNA polymerase sigma factor (sigma-70 family)